MPNEPPPHTESLYWTKHGNTSKQAEMPVPSFPPLWFSNILQGNRSFGLHFLQAIIKFKNTLEVYCWEQNQSLYEFPCFSVIFWFTDVPLVWSSLLHTCMTLRASACCILLRMALRMWSSWSPSSVPAREIRVDTNLPTKTAVDSEVRGSSSWLTTCMTYHRPLLPCSSLHWAICSRATETYARRHSPPFWKGRKQYEKNKNKTKNKPSLYNMQC